MQKIKNVILVAAASGVLVACVTPTKNAAKATVPSFLEVGRTYVFGDSSPDFATTYEILEVDQATGWVRVQAFYEQNEKEGPHWYNPNLLREIVPSTWQAP